MAKHQKNKTVSKGQRISSKPLKAVPGKAQVGDNNNAIRSAFLRADFSKVVGTKMGAAIIDAALATPKRTADAIKGWSAGLSFRTYQALKAQGVMA